MASWITSPDSAMPKTTGTSTCRLLICAWCYTTRGPRATPPPTHPEPAAWAARMSFTPLLRLSMASTIVVRAVPGLAIPGQLHHHLGVGLDLQQSMQPRTATSSSVRCNVRRYSISVRNTRRPAFGGQGTDEIPAGTVTERRSNWQHASRVAAIVLQVHGSGFSTRLIAGRYNEKVEEENSSFHSSVIANIPYVIYMV